MAQISTALRLKAGFDSKILTYDYRSYLKSISAAAAAAAEREVVMTSFRGGLRGEMSSAGRDGDFTSMDLSYDTIDTGLGQVLTLRDAQHRLRGAWVGLASDQMTLLAEALNLASMRFDIPDVRPAEMASADGHSPEQTRARACQLLCKLPVAAP